VKTSLPEVGKVVGKQAVKTFIKESSTRAVKTSLVSGTTSLLKPLTRTKSKTQQVFIAPALKSQSMQGVSLNLKSLSTPRLGQATKIGTKESMSGRLVESLTSKSITSTGSLSTSKITLGQGVVPSVGVSTTSLPKTAELSKTASSTTVSIPPMVSLPLSSSFVLPAFNFGGFVGGMGLKAGKGKPKKSETRYRVRSSPLRKVLYGESDVPATKKWRKKYFFLAKFGRAWGSLPTLEETKSKKYKKKPKNRIF
jgi:hypothetical protein